MTTLEAVGHIGASVAAIVMIGTALMFIDFWISEKNGKRLLEEWAAKLGVTVKDLEREDLQPKIAQISAERCSDELLRNRLSDFCGLALVVWGWLAAFIQLGVLGATVWFTVTDAKEHSVWAWAAVSVALLCALIGLGLAFTCRVLTGRYPYEAKGARKALNEHLQRERERQQRQRLERYKQLQADLDSALERQEELASFGFVKCATVWHSAAGNIELALPSVEVHERDGRSMLRISPTFASSQWQHEEKLEHATELWSEIEKLGFNELPEDILQRSHFLYNRMEDMREKTSKKTFWDEHPIGLWSHARIPLFEGREFIVDHRDPKPELERALGLKFERLKFPGAVDGDDPWYEAPLAAPGKILEQLEKLFPQRVFVCGVGWNHEQREGATANLAFAK